jgi:hypothetical protein
MSRSIVLTPARGCGQASSALFCFVTVLLAVVLASCAAGRASEDRLSRGWRSVQEQFDRLVAFELEFRVAAAAAAGKTEAEKVRFVRDALDHRSQLQMGLKRELRQFTRAVASEPQVARLPYSKRVRVEMDRLMAVQAETLPSVKALALDKFEGELRDHQAKLDAALRDAR